MSARETRLKAISLWQPWASAIALDLKHYETRHWATRHRGWLAIHAAKRKPEREPFHPLLPQALPRGGVVAIAVLSRCIPTETLRPQIDDGEALWGNYAVGRWAWELQDIHPLAEPIPVTGRQGMFWLTPDETEDVLTQALPDGLSWREGQIQFQCGVCSAWSSYEGAVADFTQGARENVCGGSPRCVP